MAVRFIVEVAWQAHFIKNMFIAPTEEELKEAIEHQRNDTAISLEERLNIAVWRLGGW